MPTQYHNEGAADPGPQRGVGASDCFAAWTDESCKDPEERRITRISFRRWALVAACLTLAPAWSPAAEFQSYARVNDDGSLKVGRRTVHLYGIHIPKTDRVCRRSIRPVRCAPRAALALDFKIDTFVRCERKAERPDRSVVGQCWVDDEDLSAYLLARGWAAALPDAPVEYQVLERIARRRGLGVWGLPLGEL